MVVSGAGAFAETRRFGFRVPASLDTRLETAVLNDMHPAKALATRAKINLLRVAAI